MSGATSATYCLMGGSAQPHDIAGKWLKTLAAAAVGDGSVHWVLEPASIATRRAVATSFEDELSLRTYRYAEGESEIGASLIYIFGGNPAEYVRRLEGSSEWSGIMHALRRGAALAGSSAGAECLGGVARDLADVRHGGTHAWLDGLNLFPNTFIGTHWDGTAGGADTAWRHEFNVGLVAALGDERDVLAVDEQTAAIGDGVAWTVHGQGKVHTRHRGQWSRFSPGDKLTLSLLEKRE